MGKRGFTLIETLMGLSLLGLIAVIILPIINSSFTILNNHNLKLDMMYVGEMTIEKIKAFDIDKGSNDSIYDIQVSEIIALFKSAQTVEITMPRKQSSEKYYIKIIKEHKSDGLWKINVCVYQRIEEGSTSHVEYKAYLPEK